MNLEELVLGQLSVNGFASGEAISQGLSISRTAVWKQIAKLRQRGYVIEASPRRGYRLLARPDKLLSAELQPLLTTQLIGCHIVHLEQTASTTEIAKQLVAQNAAEGTVVIAESQTSGRGRLGRVWQTGAGEAIALSIILYPRFSPLRAPLLGLATALAAADAIAAVTGLEIQLKWPNDLYLGGKKLGGILVEVAAELDRLRWAVDSLGINVNNDFQGSELAGTATSLRLELGHPVERVPLTAALLTELESYYLRAGAGGFADVAAQFQRRDLLQGQAVRVAVPDGLVEGTAVGIDESGRLLVREQSGQVQALFSGEATLAGGGVDAGAVAPDAGLC